MKKIVLILINPRALAFFVVHLAIAALLSAASQFKEPLHILVPGDVISISVLGQRDLSVPRVTVASDGTVRLQLINYVKIAGMPIDQAARYVSRLYEKDFLKQANVIVNLLTPKKFKISIMFVGEFSKKGRLKFDKGIDLLAAIVDGGGLKKSADRSSLIIIRKGPESKKPKTLSFDYDKLISGEQNSPKLQAGDLVKIEESFF